MNNPNVKTAPQATDAVNVMWRSHATNVMREKCSSLTEQEVKLGRVSLKNTEYPKLQGYVVFYAVSDGNMILIKAFQNEHRKPRTALVVPLADILKIMEYTPGSTFRAVCNVEWRYAVRGEDCEILNEDFYRQEKRSNHNE